MGLLGGIVKDMETSFNINNGYQKRRDYFLQVTLPTPAPEPLAGKLEMTPVANPMEPCGV